MDTCCTVMRPSRSALLIADTHSTCYGIVAKDPLLIDYWYLNQLLFTRAILKSAAASQSSFRPSSTTRHGEACRVLSTLAGFISNLKTFLLSPFDVGNVTHEFL